jgi:putative DNA primase/helicase
LPGIDFKAENGYIIAPPSKHVSGQEYKWVRQKSLERIPLWLLELVQNKTCEASETSLDQIANGKRNSTLTSIAGFLKAKGVSSNSISGVIPKINQESCNPPLPEKEVFSILQSIEKYNSWGPIKKLEKAKTSLLPLKKEYLPDSIRPWITDVCERMQVSLEFVAAPTILAMSTLIGRKLAVKPMCHDNWTVIPNLWGLLVADPGSMKSAAIQQAMSPLHDLEKKARKKFQAECQDFAKEQKNIALEMDTLKQSIKLDWGQGLGEDIKNKQDRLKSLSGPQSESPIEKRYKTNDPTIEKLALIMQDNPQGILLLRDEISGWLESLSKSGREGSREFYLEAWNGNGSFSIDRIGRGTTYTESVCLSIFGGIQPDKLKKYMDRYEASCGNDGFLERFQVAVYPDARTSWQLIDRNPDEPAKKKAFDTFESLDQISIDEASPVVLSFSPKAQEAYNTWRSKLELRLISSDLSNHQKSYLSKYRSLMPSLALIFHTAKDNDLTPEILLSSVQQAICWCEVLESHTNKILGLSLAPEAAAEFFLDKMKEGEIYNGQRVREISRKKWKGLTSSNKINQAITLLQEHGYLIKSRETSRGTASDIIYINPSFDGGYL